MSTTNKVDYQRPEVTEHLPDWDKVDDVVEGERTVKAKTTVYLPRPNPTDDSPENGARYTQYVERAVFVNFTSRTLEGLIGIAFKSGPDIEVPTSMDFILTDTDGAGGGIENQSHRLLKILMKTGRSGLLVDFPVANEAISKKQQVDENIHATITVHQAKSIINWRLDEKQNLTLVVIREMVEEPDGFGVTMIEQWRELSIGGLMTVDEGENAHDRYVVRIWRKNTTGDTQEFFIWDERTPKDAAGNEWAVIPFTFVGAVDNNSEVDKAPLQDLGDLNIAHYRNSADYEESAFFMGQPWLTVSGLDEHWADKYFKDGTYVGSRAVTLLPEGGAAKILQAKANTLAGEAMVKKETQMIALGAKLLTRGEAVKTVEQSRSEIAAVHSVLSLAATNMALAYTVALGWVAMFTRGANDAVSYIMPTDYTEITADPAFITAVRETWQGGGIPASDKNAAYREIRLIHPEKTDEEIAAELESEGGGLELDE